jgi:hypothetical protein
MQTMGVNRGCGHIQSRVDFLHNNDRPLALQVSWAIPIRGREG